MGLESLKKKSVILIEVGSLKIDNNQREAMLLQDVTNRTE